MSIEEQILRWSLHFIGVVLIWYLAVKDYGKSNFKNWLKTFIIVIVIVVLLGLKLND
jgi:hypothetical protein